MARYTVTIGRKVWQNATITVDDDAVTDAAAAEARVQQWLGEFGVAAVGWVEGDQDGPVEIDDVVAAG